MRGKQGSRRILEYLVLVGRGRERAGVVVRGMGGTGEGRGEVEQLGMDLVLVVGIERVPLGKGFVKPEMG